MLVIDFTRELALLVYGLNALLIVSALAVAAEPMARVVRKWMHTLQRPRFTVGRPALGHR